MSATLSAIILSKNSAELLPDCLTSLEWVDEIVLFDSGSKDNTIQLASDAGAKVFIDTDWQGYGIQRQRAQRYATGDYVLMIDADERSSNALRESIQIMLKFPQDDVVYSIARLNYFLGRFMRYSGCYPDRVVRLYDRKRYQYNSKRVHESLVFNDVRVIPLEGNLLHFTGLDFINFQKKQLNYAKAWATEYHQRGKKVSFIEIFIYTLGTFLNVLLLKGGVLDGKQGWLLAVTNAQYVFNKYTHLWVLNRDSSKKNEL